jgi:aspartyl-tRNA(Asn)/glutamyl-tRNA(Gln) amidotransferase subunit A
MTLWQLSAGELDRLYEDGAASPVEVVQQCLQRQRATHGRINALCTLDEAGALQAARESEARMRQRQRRGPLDGVPFTVKDNLFAGGLRATWGSKVFEGFVPADDDLVVARLRAAGACLLGKTNTPELALAGRTDNLLFGTTRNPVDLRLTPGGSSGGAVAATAAGVAPLAIGTDAGGSTRLPSSYTGLFGLRPSTGRIPRCHGFPPLASDFQVIGLMARTLPDIVATLQAVAGPNGLDPSSLRLPALGSGADRPPPRLRWVDGVDGEAVDPAVRAACRAAVARLRQAGLEVRDGPAPYDLDRVRAVWGVISSAGVARALQDRPDWRERVTPDIARLADAGAGVAAEALQAALDEVAAMRSAVAARFGEDDFVLTPTAAVLPWPCELPYASTVDGRPGTPRSASVFSTWVNACGLPAISLPLALAPDGLPVGLQLVGRFGQDAALLDAARRLCASCPPPAARFHDAPSGPGGALVSYAFDDDA